MNLWLTRRLSSLRRTAVPIRLQAGPEGWTATWTGRRNGAVGEPVSVEFHDAPPESALADPERFGRALAERLRAAGARDTTAVVMIPLDWTAAFRVDRPNGLASADVASYLELQAERLAPFGGAGWRLAAPPDAGEPATSTVTAAVMPESRWSALERLSAAAGLRWGSVQTDLPSHATDDAPAALELMPYGARLIAVARERGRALDWSSHPAATPSEISALASNLRMFVSSLPAEWRVAAPVLRWRGTPVATVARAVDEWRHAAGYPRPEESPPATGAAFDFVRADVAVQPAWLRALRARVPRGGRRALLAAAAVATLVVGGRWLVEGVLRARAGKLAPVARETSDLQQRSRRYRAWLEPERAGAVVLEALASSYSEDGRAWARRVELRDNRRVVCVGAARTSADAVALLERLRRAPGVRDVQAQYIRGGDPVQFAFEFEWRAAP
jgi:hypothetical protein